VAALPMQEFYTDAVVSRDSSPGRPSCRRHRSRSLCGNKQCLPLRLRQPLRPRRLRDTLHNRGRPRTLHHDRHQLGKPHGLPDARRWGVRHERTDLRARRRRASSRPRQRGRRRDSHRHRDEHRPDQGPTLFQGGASQQRATEFCVTSAFSLSLRGSRRSGRNRVPSASGSCERERLRISGPGVAREK